MLSMRFLVPLALLLILVLALASAAGMRQYLLKRQKQILRTKGLDPDPYRSAEEMTEDLCSRVTKKEEADQLALHRNREFMISRFLSDHSRESEILDLQARANLLLHSDTLQMYGYWFTAWYTEIVNMEELCGKDNALRMDYLDALAYLRNALETAVNRLELGYCVEEPKGYLCLINFRDTDQQTVLSQLSERSQALEAACADALGKIQQETGLICRVAVAEPFCDIRALRRVSNDLQTMLDYEMLSGSQKPIVTFDNVTFPDPPRQEMSLMERRFFEALVSKDLAASREALSRIMDLEERGSLESVRRVRQKMCLRLGIAADVYGYRQDQAEDVDEALARMESVSSYEEMRRYAFGVLELLESQSAPISSSNAQSLVAFVDDHYCDQSLSLQLLSEQFGMSQSGVSRAIKNVTGKRMVDYVHGLRIEEAQRLLRDTELTIYEISDRVGYNTAWTMTRAFKRYTSMTPGSWREQEKQGENGA